MSNDKLRQVLPAWGRKSDREVRLELVPNFGVSAEFEDRPDQKGHGKWYAEVTCYGKCLAFNEEFFSTMEEAKEHGEDMLRNFLFECIGRLQFAITPESRAMKFTAKKYDPDDPKWKET